MNYDFFTKHHRRIRFYKNNEAPAVIGSPLIDLYKTEAEASKHYQVLSRPSDLYDFETPSLVRCNGVYFKGGQSIAPLEASLKTKLPEDFAQFYEQFGESMIFTRSEPMWIMPLQEMIDAYEDDPDIDVEVGRFFRFAKFPDISLWLGFRRDDQSDAWQVVVCDYGLLYSEMIGPEGREAVVAPLFYDWLKALIETDGDLAKVYPRYPYGPRLIVDDEPDKTS